MKNFSDRLRRIALSAGFAAKGETGNLKKELDLALDDGMSVSELREILMHVYAYAGFPQALNGINALIAVLDARKEKSLPCPEGTEASVLPADSDKDGIGAEIRERLTGKRPVPAYAKFAPDMDSFLKQHLFCDLFTRGVLTDMERELVTISVIASEPRAEKQLATHLAICRRQGFSEEETAEWQRLMDEYINGRNSEPIFRTGVLNEKNAAYFSGKNYVNPLASSQMRVTNVTFEAGCRNNWHIHHKGGQILLVTEGTGWYQEWGMPARKLVPGDVVDIMPEVKHWHGAAADSRFVHIALSVPAEGASTEWLEPVSGADYEKLAEV